MVLINNLQLNQAAQIKGTVAQIIDADEFILRDRTGQILVDADLDGRRLRISKGDRVIVRGRVDDDDFEFDAFRVRKRNGNRVETEQSLDNDRFDDDVLGTDRFGDDDDIIAGTNKRDALVGTNDEDILIGKGRRDVLTGGSDNDLFVYDKVSEGRDRITDFSTSEDAFYVRSILDKSKYSSSNPLEDYFEFQQRGAKTQVRIDPDGDTGDKGFRVLTTLDNVVASDLSSSNFIV